ncbi:MAG: aminotransferase class III-fold pyridoxal phosphate-dependent enzyme [Chloroflexales bacterium]|nr:aminotransferase class III-fold pyridoxal phosphate-dependent enzyme [Chloroflexales bacterium]
MTILETYQRLHPRSALLAAQAREVLPSGLTHDARHAEPFPLYVERSNGAYKWDVDGNAIIDYWTGHGALLLGHAHPAISAAVQQQMARGTHYGAEHALTLRWSELVQQLFPSIEMLRFTASGTEATMLAVRLARAYTGRPAVVRFVGHFHGWHDSLAHGMEADLTPPPGVLPALVDATVVLPTDIATVEEVLRTRDDIAAVIIEPTGASYGMVPLSPGFLRALRKLTYERDVLLICDEVVTGFRVRPGGAQEREKVVPDLTTLAKILAGGLPGGAVGGRADLLQLLAFGDAAHNRERKVRHNGTFNANPLSAAAGVAALEHVVGGDIVAQTNARGNKFIADLNAVLRARDLRGWAIYGDGSIFHLIADSATPFAPGDVSPDVPLGEIKRGGNPAMIATLRLALLNHGVDFMRGRSGFLSTEHSSAVLATTVERFDRALGDVLAEADKQLR